MIIRSQNKIKMKILLKLPYLIFPLEEIKALLLANQIINHKFYLFNRSNSNLNLEEEKDSKKIKDLRKRITKSFLRPLNTLIKIIKEG